MKLSEYLQKQIKEALGDVNKYYCSIRYGRCVTDPETLLRHYAKCGGAADFHRRYGHLLDRDTNEQTKQGCPDTKQARSTK